MRYVKPKADPSKTLAIILIGACLMLFVDLFVLDGKSLIWPPKPSMDNTKTEISTLRDQHSKYLDEGVSAPAPLPPQDQFIKEVNLEPQKSGGKEEIASLPYEEFYYNTPSSEPYEIAPAAGEGTEAGKTESPAPSPDPYFKTDLQPFIDEDIRETEVLDLPPAPTPLEKKVLAKPVEEKVAHEPPQVKVASIQPQEAIQTPAPVKANDVPIKKGTVVIIIDDMGLSAHSREVENLPGPLTLAYLPYAEGLPARTAYAKKRGHELMVHMPMQPQNANIDGGPTLLRTDQSEEKFKTLLRYNLERFEGFVGVNNHMGSKLTTNRKAMKIVMEELRRRGLYFVDSKTIGSSVAAQVASEMGLKFAERDIFLDHEISLSFVRNALKKVEATAKQQGYAIAIGHPHEITIQVLKEWLPTLKDKGLTLRPASAVVHYDSPAVLVAHTAQEKTAQPEIQEPERPLAQNPAPPEKKSGFVVTEDGSIVIP